MMTFWNFSFVGFGPLLYLLVGNCNRVPASGASSLLAFLAFDEHIHIKGGEACFLSRRWMVYRCHEACKALQGVSNLAVGALLE